MLPPGNLLCPQLLRSMRAPRVPRREAPDVRVPRDYANAVITLIARRLCWPFAAQRNALILAFLIMIFLSFYIVVFVINLGKRHGKVLPRHECIGHWPGCRVAACCALLAGDNEVSVGVLWGLLFAYVVEICVTQPMLALVVFGFLPSIAAAVIVHDVRRAFKGHARSRLSLDIHLGGELGNREQRQRRSSAASPSSPASSTPGSQQL